MDDLDKAKLQGKAYIFVDYDKMSSFPNTTDASIHRPMCIFKLRSHGRHAAADKFRRRE